MALDDSDGQKGKSHGSTTQIPVLLTLGGCDLSLGALDAAASKVPRMQGRGRGPLSFLGAWVPTQPSQQLVVTEAWDENPDNHASSPQQDEVGSAMIIARLIAGSREGGLQ